MRASDPLEIVMSSARVLDALPIVAFMARPDGRIVYLSQGWSNLTGLEISREGLGSYRDVVAPGDVERIRRSWRQALRDGSDFREEFGLRYADGRYRFVLAQAAPMAENALVGWFGTLTDIDELKRAQAALARSEEQYRAFAEALPGITWGATPDGKLDFIGERWSRSRGRDPLGALGDAWVESLHPEDRTTVLAIWRDALATGAMYDAEFRTQMADGSYRWQLVRALPVRDAEGRIVRWAGVNLDIDDRKRAAEAREMFVALAENSDDCIAIVARDGSIEFINQAGQRLLGIASPEERKKTNVVDFFDPLSRSFVETEILPTVDRLGRFRGDVSFRNFKSGATIPVEFNAFQIFDSTGVPLGIATVSRDRRERERVGSGLRLLARTGAVTIETLDADATVTNIARVCVEEFASYCIVDIRDASGAWRRTAAHRAPDLQRVLEQLSPPSAQHPVMRALEAGESTCSDVDDTWIEKIGGEVDRERAVLVLDVRSFITVPVVTPTGEIVGALTCAIDGTAKRERYGAEDTRFVEEVGRRVGGAIANAKIFARERRIAVELQAASLPTALPRVDHLHLDADYRPGSDEATIGGDWYDAFALDDGRIAITVGDVLGHGLHAAITMTKLRQAMQAAAMMHPDPNAMLAVADKTLRLIDPDGYATAIAAIYDRTAHTLTFASAGHPGPALRHPNGLVEDCTRSGLMLGLRAGVEREPNVVAAEPGGTIVFYTDGIIEATRDVEAGSLRLHEALANERVRNDAAPARAIVDYVLAGADASDDIAVLVARIGPAAEPEASPERQTTYVEGGSPERVLVALERLEDSGAVPSKSSG